MKRPQTTAEKVNKINSGSALVSLPLDTPSD